MATTVTVHEAKEQLTELIHLAEQGEEIVIAQDDQSKVKLVPIAPKKIGQRVFGEYRGKIRMSENFNDPLPNDFWLGGTLMCQHAGGAAERLGIGHAGTGRTMTEADKSFEIKTAKDKPISSTPLDKSEPEPEDAHLKTGLLPAISAWSVC